MFPFVGVRFYYMLMLLGLHANAIIDISSSHVENVIIKVLFQSTIGIGTQCQTTYPGNL